MPKRSAILQLPEEIREELDRRLVQSGFAGYIQLSEWLAEQGFQIGKSSIHVYGSEFEKKLGALRIASQQAKAIAEAVGDDQNAMGEALVNLAQEKAFQVLMDMQINPDEQDFAKLTRSIAELNRAAVQQKKFAEEVKAKAQKVADEIAADAGSKGLSPEFAAQIRAKVLGIAG
ncbi:MAG: DUF3486 family protein [Tildeniella torsiva UHER 1998/13D]|jgi:hypothetical protein|nr:DUF3486 family protein [Tildeniella torsiva UHER 1998/13D]